MPSPFICLSSHSPLSSYFFLLLILFSLSPFLPFSSTCCLNYHLRDVAALPPAFPVLSSPSSPPSFPSPPLLRPFLALPLPLSFLWIASLLILIAYALP